MISVCCIVFMAVDRTQTGFVTRWSVCAVLCSWLLTEPRQGLSLDDQCVLYCVRDCWQNPDRVCQWMTAWRSLTWNPVTRSGLTPVIMRVTNRRARKLSVYELCFYPRNVTVYLFLFFLICFSQMTHNFTKRKMILILQSYRISQFILQSYRISQVYWYWTNCLKDHLYKFYAIVDDYGSVWIWAFVFPSHSVVSSDLNIWECIMLDRYMM